MKWILAILLLISASAFSQIGLRDDSTKYIRYQNQYGSRIPRYWADSAFHLPYFDTAIIKPQKAGAIMMHLDKNVYKWNGGGWESMGSANGITALSNVGTGYPWATTPHGSIKKFNPTYGLAADSSTSNTISVKVDTTSGNHIVTTSQLKDTAAAIRAASGGGGTPGGSTTQIQYNNSGAFAGDAGLTYDATGNEITTDSVIAKKGKIDTVRVQVTAAKTNKTVHIFGTSVGYGYYTQGAGGALDTTRRWSAYVARSMNLIEKNYGVASMTMQDRSPGATNFLDDRMAFVPTYNSATDSLLFYEFGINDATKTGQGLTNYNTTNFITDYSTAIDDAISKGWPLNRIYIIASNWVDPVLNASNSQATQDAYYVATKTVASNKGVGLIDVYLNSYVNRGHYFYSDGMHPSNVGHSEYAIKVLDDLNAAVYKDAQTVAANGVTELQTVKLKGTDTADIYYQPIAVNQSNKAVKLANGFFIENGPLVPQQGRINMRGFIDVTGSDAVDGVIRGKMLRATGARAAVGAGAGWEFFYDGSISQLYSFDQGAIAWKPIGINSSTYQWNSQGNSAFGFALDNNAQILSTGNKDGIHFNAISNSSTGGSGSAVLQVGPSSTMGDGIMLRYNGSGFTTNGAFEQATSIIDAGPNVSNGLNILASHASAGIKFFTGGYTTGNERMRLTSGGSLLINRTSAIASEKLSVNGKINATADSSGSPVNMLWMDTNGEIKKAAVPSGSGGITSINGETGPAYTIVGGTGINVSNTTNTAIVNIVQQSSALPHPLTDFYSPVNNTGTSESDLFAYTTTSNTLAVDGQKIVFKASGTFNDITTSNQIRLYWGATEIFNSGGLAISSTGAWSFETIIIRSSSSTAIATTTFISSSTSITNPVVITDLTSQNFATTNEIKVTGTAAGAGGGSNDITAKMGYIMFLPIPI